MSRFKIFLCLIARVLFSLRYRVEFAGQDSLSSEQLTRSQGILFLPNHPAYIDNPILMVYLWPKFKIRPLAGEQFHYSKILRPFIKFANALSIPDFKSSVSPYKIRKANEVLDYIAKGLAKGENFMLSPAGHTKNGEREILEGASGVHTILAKAPHANIALIRVTGLWGSSFSRAITGKSPDVPKVLWHGIKALLENFLFFTPRRRIKIEIEVNPADFPRAASRVECNRYLENWYNRYPDPLQLVSYSVWRKKTLPITQSENKNCSQASFVSPNTREKIYRELRRILHNPQLDIRPEMSLGMDLGLDSMNIAELMAYLFRNYSIKEFDLENFKTVQDVLNAAEGSKMGSSSLEESNQADWPTEVDRPPPTRVTSRTVLEAFLVICEKMGSCAACRDDVVGILSYKTLRRAVLVLAEYFRTLPESNVAVLLPSSAGAVIVYLALLFAGKVPVMLNWTLGPRYLEEMMKKSGTHRIISSWQFLDRATNVDLGAATNQVQCLEDIRAQLPLKMKLRGALLAHRSPQRILNTLQLESVHPDSAAVLLFTSGTELTPKCVPLSHRNLLYASSSVVPLLGPFSPQDGLFSILPPFHVFGLVFTALTPILIGLKVGFYPNPTDGHALAERVHHWKITILPSAPSFLKNLLGLANNDQLRSLRWIFSGAEAASVELIQRMAHLGKGVKFMEGYGATECSSIISVNLPSLPNRGVGLLCPDSELCTIHPETLAPLATGADGEICIRGPGVFSGYLGGAHSPFIELHGKSWYRTGDLGHLDPEGYLILSGRLKRFIKIGGEMISLGAIEEVLTQQLLTEKLIVPDSSSVAVCAEEHNSQDPKLIVFTTASLDKEFANELLRKSGFSNLIKISAVKHLDEIPILGTGKTNYGMLQSLISR